MGASCGDVFVHRNIANMFNSDDLSAMCVLEYAVKHLDVRHIVVCGHYGCGGVQASMSQKDLGILNPWLDNVRGVYDLHANELDAIENRTDRLKRLVEVNVEEQAVNILQTEVVQKAREDKGYPTVHGWVFDMQTGLLTDMELELEQRVARQMSEKESADVSASDDSPRENEAKKPKTSA